MHSIIEIYEGLLKGREATLNDKYIDLLAELTELRGIKFEKVKRQTIHWDCPKLLAAHLDPKLQKKWFRSDNPPQSIEFLCIVDSAKDLQLRIYIKDSNDNVVLSCMSGIAMTDTKKNGYNLMEMILEAISKSEEHFIEFMKLFNSNFISNGQAPSFALTMFAHTLINL